MTDLTQKLESSLSFARELNALREQNKRLVEANVELARLLDIAFTKYEDAESCYEEPSLQRGFVGKTIQFSHEEEAAMVAVLDAHDAALTNKVPA